MKRNDASIDVVCIGRAAVDLYGEQFGARLEDVTSFARYLGGSPANTAVGCARLGLSAAMLSRVGDEHNGRFVVETLAREGVDTSQIKLDPQRLTALVFLAIRSRHSFPLLFYRDRCADMALTAADIDPHFIARCRAVLISGTHLSTPETRAACRAAVDAARAAGRRVVLDIDFRPVLWGLRPLADGETRYAEGAAVGDVLAEFLGDCDLIVGTEDEFRIAGGALDPSTAIDAVQRRTAATLVVKRGEHGCTIHPHGAVAIGVPGFAVEVVNVLGAGDAFMAGFLSGWLRDAALGECGRRANACGALVVSRHGCAPAIPTAIELETFLRRGSTTPKLREDAVLNHLHRVTTRRPAAAAIAALAFDHRTPFEQLAAEVAAPRTRIADFKRLIARAVVDVSRLAQDLGVSCGVIVDDRYGADLLPEFDSSSWWIARPVEEPGSRPLQFEGGRNVLAMLREWPAHHIAKCLVAFDPDDPASICAQQIGALRQLGSACADTHRELLIEVIPPTVKDDVRSADDVVLRAIQAIVAAGVLPDWWKLQAPASATQWSRLDAAIRRADPHCRGVLLLGLDAPIGALADQLAAAANQPLCRGFAVGRTIFGDAARSWLTGAIDDRTAVEMVADRYFTLLSRFAEARSAPPAPLLAAAG